MNEEELKILSNRVSGYFDLAEINAIEHKPMYMSDYVSQLDSVLQSGNRKLLMGSGKVSYGKAVEKAKTEYRKYQELTISPVEQVYMETIKGAGLRPKHAFLALESPTPPMLKLLCFSCGKVDIRRACGD